MNTEGQPGTDGGETSLQLSADEMHLTWLKREASIGYAQLEAGQTVTVGSKAEFIALLRREH